VAKPKPKAKADDNKIAKAKDAKPDSVVTHNDPIEEQDVWIADDIENEAIFPDKVIVDFEQACIPRSDVAKRVYARRLGDPAIAESLPPPKPGTGGAIYDVCPYDLKLESGWNKRNFHTEQRRRKIASLGLSISRVGVREPLLCHIKNGKVFVHSGWNRWFATIYAIEVEGMEIQRIPIRFGRTGENDEDRNLSQVVNNGSDRYLPLEMARVIKDQVNVYQWPIPRVAASLGYDAQNVLSLLKLLEMPAAVLRYVDEGTIRASFARRTYRDAHNNEEKTIQIIEGAIQNAHDKGRNRVMPQDAPGFVRKRRGTPRPALASPLLAAPNPDAQEFLRVFGQREVLQRDDREVVVRYHAKDFDKLERLEQIVRQGRLAEEEIEA
jgi:hypothetical protein